MLELNKLYNMDCMQGMKEFPDGFFDLAIVDPPYGIGILDTHAGSGSSLIACYRQGGLDFVGFEIDEDYCRAANERLEQEQAQIRLFDLLEQEERKAQATLFTK